MLVNKLSQSAERVHLFYFFDHARVVVVVPLCQSDPFLHLLEGVLQHLCELCRHVFYSFFEFQDLVLFVFEFFVLFFFGESDGLVVFF